MANIQIKKAREVSCESDKYSKEGKMSCKLLSKKGRVIKTASEVDHLQIVKQPTNGDNLISSGYSSELHKAWTAIDKKCIIVNYPKDYPMPKQRVILCSDSEKYLKKLAEEAEKKGAYLE